MASWTAAAVEGLVAKRAACDAFFAGPIQRFEITLAPAEWQALQRENRKYVRATVKVGDRTYPDVGIHLKGAAGSFRQLDQNTALTLNFNKFVQAQEFQRLDKIHLNHAVQDPNTMPEFL